MCFAVYYIGANAQNINDPYNMLGSPQNPNNIPQANYDAPEDESDTVKAPKEKYGLKNNPRIASIASALLPGAGQIYNGKFWKVPIIWGLFGTFGYMVVNNHKRYQDYRAAFIYLARRNPSDFNDTLTAAEAQAGYNQIRERYTNTILPFDSTTTGRAGRFLEFRRDDARRNRDWMTVFLLLTYVCNIMDAAVDAHFANFDVSDNLALRVRPEFQGGTGVPLLGVNFTLAVLNPRTKQAKSIYH